MRLRRIAFVAGIVLFLWLLRRIGLGTIERNLARIGWGFAAVLALESAVLLLRTLAWRRMLPPAPAVSFGSLLAMRLSGEGVNSLLPAAVVGGEAVRAGLLRRFVPGAEGLGSVVLAAMTEFLAQALFVGIGAIVAEAGNLQPRLSVLGAAILAFVVAFLVVLRRIPPSREGPPGRLQRLLDRVSRGFTSLAPREGFWTDLRQYVVAVVRNRPGDLAFSVVFFLCAWSVSVVEIGLILRLLGARVPAGTAFSIAVLLVLVEGALFFVPARIGVQEGGLYGIFLALGLDPALGFSLGIVRRLREAVWGLAGLAVLAFLRGHRSDAPGLPGGPLRR